MKLFTLFLITSAFIFSCAEKKTRWDVYEDYRSNETKARFQAASYEMKVWQYSKPDSDSTIKEMVKAAQRRAAKYNKEADFWEYKVDSMGAIFRAEQFEKDKKDLLK